MVHIIGWIVFGLVVGVIAKLLMPGRDLGGCIVTMLLGIGGSLLGGFIGRMLGGEGHPAGWIGSVVCAILILWIYRMVMKKNGTE
ncbi:MAG TPA: GlsB/YeaQ/YmgE family stress response membrane protein [Planctomycetota bacterium]